MNNFFIQKALFCTAATACSVFAGEDRSFDEPRIQVCNQIQAALVQEGICNSRNDCTARQLIFCSPMSGGIDIQVWGVQNQAIANASISIIGNEFTRQQGRMRARLTFYRDTKANSLATPFWERNKAMFKIEYSGDK